MTDTHAQSSRNAAYKSCPERQIGGLLDRYGIPFIYEKPTAVLDSGMLRVWYPDFSLQYGLLVEYFGVNGDQGYRERTAHKLKVYRENQFDVLPVYPADMGHEWQDNLLRRIDANLEHRVSEYRSRVLPVRLHPCGYGQRRAYDLAGLSGLRYPIAPFDPAEGPPFSTSFFVPSSGKHPLRIRGPWVSTYMEERASHS